MKTKLTSGILCRDRKKNASKWGSITFFCPDLLSGIWQRERVWWENQWEAEYDLEPPAPGKCFEVDIQL